MITSLKTSSTSELKKPDGALREEVLGYFAAKAQNDAHQLVLKRFLELGGENRCRAEIARRLHKRPEQVTRWLGSPGNWTLETFAHLLLAMDAVPDFGMKEVSKITIENISTGARTIAIEGSSAANAIELKVTYTPKAKT